MGSKWALQPYDNVARLNIFILVYLINTLVVSPPVVDASSILIVFHAVCDQSVPARIERGASGKAAQKLEAFSPSLFHLMHSRFMFHNLPSCSHVLGLYSTNILKKYCIH